MTLNARDQRIKALSNDTAQRAVLELWDRLPDEVFEGGRKPSFPELTAIADEVSDETTGEAEALRARLLDDPSEVLRAEVARLILREFAQVEAVQPLVDDAISMAEKPHLAPIAVVLGAVLLVLTTIKKVDHKRTETSAPDGTVTRQTQWLIEFNKPADVIKGVAAFAKLCGPLL